MLERSNQPEYRRSLVGDEEKPYKEQQLPYMQADRLVHNSSAVSDNTSAIPWRHQESQRQECDSSTSPQTKAKAVFVFPEEVPRKMSANREFYRPLSTAIPSEQFTKRGQEGRPLSTTTSLHSTNLDFESRNGSRFSSPRHSARGKKRRHSVSPIGSEFLDLTEIIRTSPSSLIAYVMGNGKNGFISRGSGRNSSAASRTSNGSFGHLSLGGSMRPSPAFIRSSKFPAELMERNDPMKSSISSNPTKQQMKPTPPMTMKAPNNFPVYESKVGQEFHHPQPLNHHPIPPNHMNYHANNMHSLSSNHTPHPPSNHLSQNHAPPNHAPHPPNALRSYTQQQSPEIFNTQVSSSTNDAQFNKHETAQEVPQTAEGTPRSADGESGGEEVPREMRCCWRGCMQLFDLQADLVQHVNADHIHKNKKDCSCYWEGCSRQMKPFKAMYMLVVHARRHTGEKPHYESCDKAYSRLENLKTHLRSHTGERPYACEVAGCDKAFSNASDRAKHQNRTHSDVKQYGCKVEGCTKRYTDPSSLRKHMKTVHGTLPQPTKKFKADCSPNKKREDYEKKNNAPPTNEISAALSNGNSFYALGGRLDNNLSGKTNFNNNNGYSNNNNNGYSITNLSSQPPINEMNFEGLQQANNEALQQQQQQSLPNTVEGGEVHVQLQSTQHTQQVIANKVVQNNPLDLLNSRLLNRAIIRRGSDISVNSNPSDYGSYSNSRRGSDMSQQSYLSARVISPRFNNQQTLIEGEVLKDILPIPKNSPPEDVDMTNLAQSRISSGYGSTTNYFPLSPAGNSSPPPQTPGSRRASEGNSQRVGDSMFQSKPVTQVSRRGSEPVRVASIVDSLPRRYSLNAYKKLPLAPAMQSISSESLNFQRPNNQASFQQNNLVLIHQQDNIQNNNTNNNNNLNANLNQMPGNMNQINSGINQMTSRVHVLGNMATSHVNNMVSNSQASNSQQQIMPVDQYARFIGNYETKEEEVTSTTCDFQDKQQFQPQFNQFKAPASVDNKSFDFTRQWRDNHFAQINPKVEADSTCFYDDLTTGALDSMLTDALDNMSTDNQQAVSTSNLVINHMDTLRDSFLEENHYYNQHNNNIHQARYQPVIYE